MVDISGIGYRWKGIYSPYLTYNNNDVVYNNGSSYVYVNGSLLPFAMSQQDATTIGQVITGQGPASGSYGTVLHSKGSAGSEFRLMSSRNGQIATSLQRNMDCGAGWGNYGVSFAIMNDGMTRSWGNSGFSNIGDGSVGSRTLPVKPAFPAGTPPIVKVYTGYKNTYFIDAKGGLWHCGSNAIYAGGDGTQTAVLTPKKLQGRGDIPSNAVITMMRAGWDWYGQACFGCLDSNGQAYMWGNNNYGCLGLGVSTASITTPKILPFSINNPLKDFYVPALTYGTCAFITVSGQLYMAGTKNQTSLGSDTNVPVLYTPLKDKVIKYFKALEQDDTSSTGSQYYTNMGLLTEDGSLYLWGHGSRGFFGTGFTGQVLQTDATGNSYLPYKVLDGVEDFYVGSGGYDRTIALMKDGTVMFAGYGGYGADGTQGTATNRTTWQQLGPGILTGITKLRCQMMSYVTCAMALKSDGTCIPWGVCTRGWTGNNQTGNSTTSVIPGAPVLLDKTIVDFAFSGGLYTTDIFDFLSVNFLTTDGSVYSTGYGAQVGDDENQDRMVPNQIKF